MKKGRHRRFEEARALKRSHEVDLEDLFEDITDAPEGEHKPEHDAWADLAEEWDSKGTDDADEPSGDATDELDADVDDNSASDDSVDGDDAETTSSSEAAS